MTGEFSDDCDLFFFFDATKDPTFLAQQVLKYEHMYILLCHIGYILERQSRPSLNNIIIVVQIFGSRRAHTYDQYIKSCDNVKSVFFPNRRSGHHDSWSPVQSTFDPDVIAELATNAVQLSVVH